MLAQTYMHRKVADIFGKTNNGHTPLAAILLCSAFGFISLSGLSNHAYAQVRIESPDLVFSYTDRPTIASANHVGLLHWNHMLCLYM